MTPDNPLSDDELGAALGRSVRGRVDDVPTITPSFDGVERRARQITNRRRGAAGLAVGALAIFGGLGASALLADDEDSLENDVVTNPDPDPSVDEPNAEYPEVGPDAEYPEVGPDDQVGDAVATTLAVDVPLTHLAPFEPLVSVAPDGTETVLLDVGGDEQIFNAVALIDGSVLATILDGSGLGPEVVRHYPAGGGDPVELSANGRLAGGAVVEGIPYAFVGDFSDEQFGFGPLRAIDLQSGTSTVLLERANGPESVVAGVDVRGDELVIEEVSEGGSTWWFRRLDGADLGVPSLDAATTGFTIQRYSPRWNHASGGLVWLEQNEDTGEWSVVVGDADGSETRRASLGLPQAATDAFFTLETTPGYWVANLAGWAAEGPGLESSVIWIDPATLDATLDFERSATVQFIEPEESAVDVTGDDPAGQTDSVASDWMDPELLGIINVESDTNIDDFGPVPTSLVGHDENGAVYAAVPVGDGDTSVASIWQVDGVLDVRYVVDPVDETNRHWVFDLGERVVQVDPDGRARVIADASHLVGADMVAGRPVAFVADLPLIAGGAVEIGDLYSIDLTTGERTILLANASQNDVFVEEVIAVNDLILITGGGFQPWVAWAEPDGSQPDIPNPDFGSLAGSVVPTTISSDGGSLHWLVEQGADPETLQPVVTVHTFDTTTATETSVSVTLPPTEIALVYRLTTVADELLITRSFDGGPGTTLFAAGLLVDPATGVLTELGLPGAQWNEYGG